MDNSTSIRPVSADVQGFLLAVELQGSECSFRYVGNGEALGGWWSVLDLIGAREQTVRAGSGQGTNRPQRTEPSGLYVLPLRVLISTGLFC